MRVPCIEDSLTQAYMAILSARVDLARVMVNLPPDDDMRLFLRGYYHDLMYEGKRIRMLKEELRDYPMEAEP